VELERQGKTLLVWYREQVVARHALQAERHRVCLLPDHGPGAIARTQRRQRSGAPARAPQGLGSTEVEVRDLTVYEQLADPTEEAA
jgi:hypothetical protein